MVAAIAGMLAFGIVHAAPSHAQGTELKEMTEAEITDAFRRQKSRGLNRIVPGTGNAQASAPLPVQIVPKEDQVNIQIAFDFDSATLRADQKPRLVALCNVMQATSEEAFVVIGHSDASGSDEYNANLSLDRARAVMGYLIADCGIAQGRLQASGMGERFLLDVENPRSAVNRRVEFQITG